MDVAQRLKPWSLASDWPRLKPRATADPEQVTSPPKCLAFLRRKIKRVKLPGSERSYND